MSELSSSFVNNLSSIQDHILGREYHALVNAPCGCISRRSPPNPRTEASTSQPQNPTGKETRTQTAPDATTEPEQGNEDAAPEIDAGTDVMSTELQLYDYLTLAPRTDRICILVCASGFPGVLSRCTFGSGLI